MVNILVVTYRIRHNQGVPFLINPRWFLNFFSHKPYRKASHTGNRKVVYKMSPYRFAYGSKTSQQIMIYNNLKTN